MSEVPDLPSICQILEANYGNPRHGNLPDPLDELVYIILSTRTRQSAFVESFARVKQEFPVWNEIRDTAIPKLTSLIQPFGLANLKARQIGQIMNALREQFGTATLAPIADMSDEEAESFLVSLPGVAKKIAKCVLMYSLDRQVLPVDVHTYRVAGRIGIPIKRRADSSQDMIESSIPAELRYTFHVNAVAHGREICFSQRPRCDTCCIAKLCRYNLEQQIANLVG